MKKQRRIIIGLVAVVLVLLFVVIFRNQIFADTAVDAPARVIFGCQNIPGTSSCLDLGAENENPSGVSFSQRAKNSSTNQYSTFNLTLDQLFQNDKITDQGFNYKSFAQTATTPSGYTSARNNLSFNTLGPVDSNGFPTDEYILEIRYKDVYRNDAQDGWKFENRLFIDSFVDYGSPRKTFLEIGKLLGVGDQNWKYEQIYFPKTSWQRIRSIDGKISFSLKDLRTDRSVPVPIDYIAFKKLTAEESSRFADWQQQNALHEIAYATSPVATPAIRKDYVETKSQPNISPSFKWFSTASMKPIYPNQYPLPEEIEKPIAISSAYGETEPFNLGVYTKQQLNNVSFTVNDLSLKTDQNIKLTRDKISVKKVVYGVKFWSSRNGNIGLQPDYPIEFSSTNIPANSSQQFWGEVKIGKDIPAGEYTGVIALNIGSMSQLIPISVTVVPVTLSEPDYIRALYHDPATPGQNMAMYDLYGTDQAIKQDMIDNGINNVIGSLDIEVGDNCGAVNYQGFKDNFRMLKSEGLIAKTAVFKMSPASGQAITKCTESSNLWWTRYRDPRFMNKFKEILTEVKNFVGSEGHEIVLIGEDEPGKFADRNMQVMVTSKVAHDVGIKVWSTYSAPAASEKLCRVDLDESSGYNYQYCEPCNNLETDFCFKKDGVSYLPGLNNYVDYKAWSLGNINTVSGQNDRSVATFKSTFGYYTTYSLQIRNPIINRFLNGYYAENAEGDGAKIIANWAYTGEAGSDPYNDFDQMPRYASTRYRQDYLLSYPSWDGKPIPTFAMKGLREGIKDAKYVATLRKLIAEHPNDQTASLARDFLNTLLDDNHVLTKYSDDYTMKRTAYGIHGLIVKYLSAGSSAGESNMEDYQVFDEKRLQIIDYIQALSSKNTGARSFSFRTGFTAFGTTERFSSNLITSQNLLLYRFDGSSNSWSIANSANSFDIEPWKAYLVYNPSSAKTLELPYSQVSSNRYKLTHGWNMLYSSNQKTFSDISIELPNGQASGLANLISQGKVLEHIFQIENQTSQDPCEYYNLLSNNLNVVYCNQDQSKAFVKSLFLPAGRAFWVYVY